MSARVCMRRKGRWGWGALAAIDFPWLVRRGRPLNVLGDALDGRVRRDLLRQSPCAMRGNLQLLVHLRRLCAPPPPHHPTRHEAVSVCRVVSCCVCWRLGRLPHLRLGEDGERGVGGRRGEAGGGGAADGDRVEVGLREGRAPNERRRRRRQRRGRLRRRNRLSRLLLVGRQESTTIPHTAAAAISQKRRVLSHHRLRLRCWLRRCVGKKHLRPLLLLLRLLLLEVLLSHGLLGAGEGEAAAALAVGGGTVGARLGRAGRGHPRADTTGACGAGHVGVNGVGRHGRGRVRPRVGPGLARRRSQRYAQPARAAGGLELAVGCGPRLQRHRHSFGRRRRPRREFAGLLRGGVDRGLVSRRGGAVG
jgi:hypothetical protein